MTCNTEDINSINKLSENLKYEYINKDKTILDSDPITSSIEAFNDYSKRVLQSTLAYRLYDFIKSNSETIDKNLTKQLPIYKTTKEYLKGISESTFIQQLSHWFNNEKFKFRDFQHQALTTYQLAVEERNKIDDTYVSNLDTKLTKYFKEDEIKDLDLIFGRSGIFQLTHSDKYNRLKTGSNTIDELIDEYKLTHKQLQIAQNKANLILGKPLTSNVLANEQTVIDKATYKKIQEVATLLSLKEVKNLDKLFNKLNKYPEIHDELIVASQSMETLYKDMLKTTKDPNYMTNTLNIDVYSKMYEKRIVTLNDLKKGRFLERNGWKILRKPTNEKLGIVYRESQHSMVEGVGTTMNYHYNELIIPKQLRYKYSKDNYVVASTKSDDITYMLPLTLEEKRQLGLIENPAHTLYRSISKYKFIKDTQVIRDTLIDSQLRYELFPDKEDSVKHLLDLIKKDEHPLYLKLPKDVVYMDLPEEIKKKYQQVTRTSNIGSFKDKVSLVRKDVAPWLQGYTKVSFHNSPFLNKTLNVIQKLVVMGKINSIVTSPTKLLMDGISNVTLLLSRGVSPLFIAKEIPKANKDLAELHKLKSELVYAKFQDILDPSKNRTKEIEDKIRKHPLNFVHYNGMSTSLSTDIFMKSFDTVSGLQQDVDNIVSKFINKSDKEELNAFGNIIKWYMNIGSKNGLTVDGFLRFIASKGDKGILKESLLEIADNMKQTRDQQDVVRYVSNFINTPASNITKFGSVVMQYEDEISRIILYKHLRNQKVPDKEAVYDVMDTFIDYRINMPKELQFASDVFILPFPYYMLKVQKVILNLIKYRPATSGGLLVYDLLNPYGHVNNMSVLGSNIISKIEKDQILADPLSIMSIFQ